MKDEEKKAQNEVKEVEADLKAALAKTLAERDEYLAGWQRAKADFVNSKKRWEESMADFRKMANEGLIEELLPVLSSFEMAWSNKAAWEKADKNWRMGVEHIYNQLKGVLEQNGLKELNPIDQRFDPNVHEAIRYEHVDDPKKDHTIVAVVEKGYMLGAKLIRPAKVVVAEPKAV